VGHTGWEKGPLTDGKGFRDSGTQDSKLQTPQNRETLSCHLSGGPQVAHLRPRWHTYRTYRTYVFVCVRVCESFRWVTWFLQSFNSYFFDYILCRFLSCKFSLPLRSQSVPGIKGYAISAYTIEHVHLHIYSHICCIYTYIHICIYIKKRGDSPGSRNLMRTWIMSLNCVVS